MANKRSVDTGRPVFTKLPEHVAIIMDGNGRWAKKRMMPRTAGHVAGVRNFHDIVNACGEIGIRYLTVYAFSSENWERDQEEVDALIRLIDQSVREYTAELLEKNVRLRLVGDMDRFPEGPRTSLQNCVKTLDHCTGLTLSLCLSYGGRQELVRAFRLLAEEGRKDITAEDISSHLYTSELPDPDLVIRTGGEYRVSNFLLWQSAYAEYYFTDVFWPDFHEPELIEALRAFEKRKRRFGR